MKYYLLGISWAIVIGILSVTPNPTRSIEIDHSDKIAHFGAYAILVAALLWGAQKHQQLTRKHINNCCIFYYLWWGNRNHSMVLTI